MRLYNIGLFLCIYMFEERQRVELQRGHRVETVEREKPMNVSDYIASVEFKIQNSRLTCFDGGNNFGFFLFLFSFFLWQTEFLLIETVSP